MVGGRGSGGRFLVSGERLLQISCRDFLFSLFSFLFDVHHARRSVVTVAPVLSGVLYLFPVTYPFLHHPFPGGSQDEGNDVVMGGICFF